MACLVYPSFSSARPPARPWTRPGQLAGQFCCKEQAWEAGGKLGCPPAGHSVALLLLGLLEEFVEEEPAVGLKGTGQAV